MQGNDIPVIDWELGIRLAGNQRDLAADLLAMIVSELPETLISINQCYASNDFTNLLKHVHKLHGAVSYCGLPRLKSLLSQLESDLKKNIMDSLPSHLEQLDTEVNLILEHHPKQKA